MVTMVTIVTKLWLLHGYYGYYSYLGRAAVCQIVLGLRWLGIELFIGGFILLY